jgi:hypothetical protein
MEKTESKNLVTLFFKLQETKGTPQCYYKHVLTKSVILLSNLHRLLVRQSKVRFQALNNNAESASMLQGGIAKSDSM